MKKSIASAIVLLNLISANAMNTDQKFVIDVTSTDNKVYQSVLLTIDIMSRSHPEATIEVVAYGEAVPIFMKDRSPVASQIMEHAGNKNIIFTACEVSMELFNIRKEELLPGVGTVENAIVDIVLKQQSGWGYIKSGN
jgi:intracellular sulfur oxidation DsrE/DsrF family protein